MGHQGERRTNIAVSFAGSDEICQGVGAAWAGVEVYCCFCCGCEGEEEGEGEGEESCWFECRRHCGSCFVVSGDV